MVLTYLYFFAIARQLDFDQIQIAYYFPSVVVDFSKAITVLSTQNNFTLYA